MKRKIDDVGGLNCPKDHRLVPFIRNGGTCDGCSKSFDQGERTLNCGACDFDLCSKCAGPKRAANIQSMSIADVATYVSSAGLETAAEIFKLNEIDGAAAVSLNSEDIKGMPFSIGERKKVEEVLATLGNDFAANERRRAGIAPRRLIPTLSYRLKAFM